MGRFHLVSAPEASSAFLLSEAISSVGLFLLKSLNANLFGGLF
uniref:Uncharacterized protein n=1 Tax=Arundo donax TaxID=35708 RepID=A0A0A9E970_ARUDO